MIFLCPSMYGCNLAGGNGSSNGLSGFETIDSDTDIAGVSSNGIAEIAEFETGDNPGFTGDESQFSFVAVNVSTDSNRISTVTNPEPATMLLLGGGMLAMAYYGKRRNRQT